MSEREMWHTSPRFLNERVKAAQRRAQELWEIERFGAWVNISPHLKKSVKIYDVAKFPWEKAAKMPEMSDEEFRQRSELLDRVLAQHFANANQ